MPAPLPIHRISNARLQSKGILKIIEEGYQHYPSIFCLQFEDNSELVILGEAQHIEYWENNNDHFSKNINKLPLSSAIGRMILGDTLTFAAEGDEWRNARKITTSILNPKRPILAESMEQAAQWLVNRLRSQEPTPDLWPLCLEWALRCVLTPFLGKSVPSEAIYQLVDTHQQLFFHLLQQSSEHEKVDMLLDQELQSFRESLFNIVESALEHSHLEPDTALSLLSTELNIDAEPGNTGSLVNIIMGNLLGSIDNPATSLMWTLVHLANNPQFIERIRCESYKIEGKTWSIQKCPETMALIKETLRLSPVQPLIERTTTKAIELDGIPLVKHTDVLFCPWLIHRNVNYWADPLTFDIDRFTQQGRIPPSKYFPFGIGKRHCAGLSLVFNQLAIVLLTLCRHCDFAFDGTLQPIHIRPEFKLNLRPRGPVSLCVSLPSKTHNSMKETV
ncbi:cytochrome P450 [Vibrio splendidus]